MPKNFDTEIREAFNKPFLKVFIKDLEVIEEVRAFIEQLDCVGRVKVTKSKSKYSPKLNLTIYPSRVYSIEEVQTEVTISLNSYFDGNPIDPIFNDENISSISDKAYNQIIGYINKLGRNFEKYGDLKKRFDEERCRDYFLPFLNTISTKHSATGETFNKIGKIDILIQNESGDNVFIAECKIWRGQSQLSDAINQLLDRYVNWRDEKVALIVFNKTVQKFSEVIAKANETMEEHKNFSTYKGARNGTSFSYTFKHPEDDNKEICVELILFDFR